VKRRDIPHKQQGQMRTFQGGPVKLLVCLSISAILGLAIAQGQVIRSNITVRGEIVYSGSVAGLTVELASQGKERPLTALVNPDSTFEIQSAAAGSYALRVIASDGQVLHEEYVSITGPGQTLSVRLPEQATDKRAGGSVSLQQLKHKVPGSAQKAFDKGEQAAAKGRLQQARAFFQEAVALDPEFVDAYNELGAAEVGLNDLPHAADEFQKAINIVPEHPLALPNLSIVLAKMHRFHEAGDVARRALRVAPGSSEVHYVLGVSLVSEHGNLDEAITHFERAAHDIPAAHLTASDLLVQLGRAQEAIRHLEAYLQDPAADESLRTSVEARIAELRK
jgi:tetratricopeptide (TPR) repeat protein